MHSRARLWIVAVATALLISALAPFAPEVSQGAEPPIPVVISPPSGLGLPAGQHVGVRYQIAGETPATLELVADGIRLSSDWVQPGQALTHVWTPAKPGPHQLRVRTLAPDGTVLGSVSLAVTGLPARCRVWLP